MPTSSNRALTFDDLLDSDGNATFPVAGVGVNRAPDGGLYLDPRYAAQLAPTFERMPKLPTEREKIVRDGTFAAGAAPFGFAGPGSLNFDGRADASARNLDRFRRPPPQPAPPPQEPLTFSDLDGFVRSVANGLPIIGAYNNNIEASIEAAGAPVLNPLIGPEGRLTEPTFRGRYNHSLGLQNQYDEDFARRHPYLQGAGRTIGGILGTAAFVPLAPWMGGPITGSQLLRGAGTVGALWGADALARGGGAGDAMESGGEHSALNTLSRVGWHILKNGFFPF